MKRLFGIALLSVLFPTYSLLAQSCPLGDEPCDPPVDCDGGPCPTRGVTIVANCDERDCSFAVNANPLSAQPMLETLQWTFSDGGTMTTRGDASLIRHFFSSVLATSPCTGAAKQTLQVTVVPTFKDAGVQAAQTKCVDFVVDPPYFGYNTNFTGMTVEIGANKSANDGWRFSWDYGDGVTQHPDQLRWSAVCRTYDFPGRYVVTMQAWNIHDTSNPLTVYTVQQVVDVPNKAPDAKFTMTSSGKTVSVDATASRDEPAQQEVEYPSGSTCISVFTNSQVQYEWDFGDGGFARGITATHTYTAPGPYTVRLVAVDRADGRTVVEKSVTVPNDPPAAAFSFNCSGLDCDFDAGESTDDGTIKTYEWVFGSTAVTTDSALTSFHFPASGAMPVTLRVNDGSLVSPLARAMVNVTSTAPSGSLAFFPIAPCRVFDSRSGQRINNGAAMIIPVTVPSGVAKCGIPASAKAAALNFVVFDPSSNGNLKTWLGDWPPPNTSTVNFTPANSPRSNNAIVRIAPNGSVAAMPSLADAGSTHLIVDAYGYYAADDTPAAGARGPYNYTPVTPCRAYDSRNSVALSSGEVRYFPLNRVACGLPAGPAAIAGNLAILGSTAGGNASLFSSALGVPTEASTINFRPDMNLANGAAVELGGRASDDLGLKYAPATTATANFLLDVSGFFSPAGELSYHSLQPCRLLDTRDPAYGSPRLLNGQTLNVQVQGNCGVPRGASAVAVNVTALAADGGGNLRLNRSDESPGTATVLNFRLDDPAVANGAIVALSTLQRDLAITPAVFSGALGVDVILDVVGFYSVGSQSIAAVPGREKE